MNASQLSQAAYEAAISKTMSAEARQAAATAAAVAYQAEQCPAGCKHVELEDGHGNPTGQFVHYVPSQMAWVPVTAGAR